jgi:uncharacterized protein
VLAKPADVFDRDLEWSDLSEFAESTRPGLRIAVVSGRRRQGKSYLLRRLAATTGGLYHLATEQTEAISVHRFADSLADWLGFPAGALSFPGWEAALGSAIRLMGERAGPGASRPAVLVLDEFPYLTRESPGLPSIVQAIYDSAGPGSPEPRAPIRLILCGSAISVMSELLSGTKALRGRGALELRVSPFRYRDARAYWGIEDLDIAFRHNALIGGTPGYREMVANPAVPDDPARFGEWLTRNVLRPSAPLFSEGSRVIREDPRVRDVAVYASLMTAIASGETSPAKIGGLLGRESTSLTYQLGLLETAGFIERRQDMLRQRRPALSVADPVVRLYHLVVEPYLAELEAGRALEVWRDATPTVDSKIHGPHFEALVTDWLTYYAPSEADLDVGIAGPAVIACREHASSHEIDVLALPRGARPRSAGVPIAFIGEAKARDRQAGAAQLRRLEHLRDLLTEAGHDASAAILGLFSTSGFAAEVSEAVSASRGKLLTAGLAELYGVRGRA